MSLGEIYREERLISRRSRARKARIFGRIIGFGLMLGFAALLRTNPQMQDAAMALATKAVAYGMGAEPDGDADPTVDVQAQAIADLGYQQGSEEVSALEQLGISGQASPVKPAVSQMPESRVKINRAASD